MKSQVTSNVLLLAILTLCIYGFFFKSGNGRFQSQRNVNMALDTKTGILCATVELKGPMIKVDEDSAIAWAKNLPKCGE
jgi:hypothetical protein